MEPIKTLLACWDEATETAVATLGQDFVLTVSHTLGEITRQLKQCHYDLIVATIRFDESRPLDLMPLAAQYNVPVAIVRFGVSPLQRERVAAVFLAAESLGCKATLDLTTRSKAIGIEAAIAELRIALRAAAHHVGERDESGVVEARSAKPSAAREGGVVPQSPEGAALGKHCEDRRTRQFNRRNSSSDSFPSA